MPTKHIDDNIWKKVTNKTLDMVIQTKMMLKENEMLQILIMVGLNRISENDVHQYLLQKKSKSKSTAG
ncbi:hypothetical protein [Exercitatus varius]|uniref:hypothetical protein n=1 Tax=Exercitatus varius TaxID=67857 RepID=UPI00294B3269|nr:hypothetical protein [Exercitatus varius]MDG2961735.1 hypothetical protein [Exercitatus varius]